MASSKRKGEGKLFYFWATHNAWFGIADAAVFPCAHEYKTRELFIIEASKHVFLDVHPQLSVTIYYGKILQANKR